MDATEAGGDMDATDDKRLIELLKERAAGGDVVKMPGADLRGVELDRADLVGADFTGTKLDGATLIGAKMADARLKGACLKGANLSGADLFGATLVRADLESASVVGLRLTGADLRGACLKGILGAPASIAGAVIDIETVRRSELSDQDVIQLWRQGAHIDDISAFSEHVGHAVREATVRDAGDVGDSGPPSRRLAAIEEQLHRALVRDGVRRSSHPPLLTAGPGLSVAALAGTSEKYHASFGLSMQVVRIQEKAPRFATLAPGKQLLGVELKERMGSGNAGTVWRAVDGDGRAVACKVFDRERLSGLTTLARGVRAMNWLMVYGGDALPPTIARLRSVSVNELAFTTDLASGNLLDLTTLASGWPTRKIVRVMQQIAEAISWAHGAGVVHRCLKPSNVLLADDLSPIVTDFDMVDLPLLKSERPGDIGGYGLYAAPEEVLDIGMQSPTSDIFSLGRLLHFLLIGKHPDEPWDDVPKLAALEREQPAGLVRIIRKCTMRNPALRYQLVSELLADLPKYDQHDEVGIAGDERNFLAHRISTVIGTKRSGPPSPPEPAKPAAVAPTRPTESFLRLPRLSRRHELLGAGLGGLLLMVPWVTILLGAPADGPSHIASLLAAFGCGLLTLSIPASESRGTPFKLALMIAVGFLAYRLDASMFASLRLRAGLQFANTSAKAHAIRSLTTAGHRDFDGAHLEGVDLSQADVSQANFHSADLTAADLSGAQAMESNFDNATLASAVIRGADLSRSNANAAHAWTATKCDNNTRFPDGWRCEGEHPVLIEPRGSKAMP